MKKINFFEVRSKPFSGSNYGNIYKKAYVTYKEICKKSKRRTYVRSKYFKGGKIFIAVFWGHLKEKRFNDRARRLKFYNCALELLTKSKIAPEEFFNTDTKEFFYRFYGRCKSNEKFIVQIKESGKKKEKQLISIFPLDK